MRPRSIAALERYFFNHIRSNGENKLAEAQFEERIQLGCAWEFRTGESKSVRGNIPMRFFSVASLCPGGHSARKVISCRFFNPSRSMLHVRDFSAGVQRMQRAGF